MARPSVTIIVPAFGVAHLVGEALASLQAQEQADWEAIVVDDGDPDVAPSIAVFAADERIRLLETNNGGVAVARNRAAALARAPLIGLLDGDDAYCPTYLAEMLPAIEARPTLGFVTCDATYFGLSDRAGRRFSEFHSQDAPITLTRVLSRQFNVFVACVLRKEAFDAVGGYDPSLRSSEDLDLWIRLLRGGYEAAYLPRPLVRYRRRHGSLSTDTAMMLSSGRRVYEKSSADLVGRDEQAVARAGNDRLIELEARAEAERLILSGDTRGGLALLRRHDQRSLRWRFVMLVMWICPPLGGPILRARSVLNQRSSSRSTNGTDQ